MTKQVGINVIHNFSAILRYCPKASETVLENMGKNHMNRLKSVYSINNNRGIFHDINAIFPGKGIFE